MNDLVIKISGKVLNSNLDSFKEETLALIKKANTPLVCDADFVNAEETVKAFTAAEKAIVAAKSEALKETADISKLFDTLDEISASLRDTRLSLNKQVKSEKVKRKNELIKASVAKLQAILNSAKNKEVADVFAIRFNLFDDAVSGKRKLESMQEALDGVVEFEGRAVAHHDSRITDNKAILDECEFQDIIQDRKALVVLPTSELELTVTARVSNHKLAEKKREEKAAQKKIDDKKAAADKKAADEAAAQKLKDDQAKHDKEEVPASPVEERSIENTPDPTQEQEPARKPATSGMRRGASAPREEHFVITVNIFGTTPNARGAGNDIYEILKNRPYFKGMESNRAKK